MPVLSTESGFRRLRPNDGSRLVTSFAMIDDEQLPHSLLIKWKRSLVTGNLISTASLESIGIAD